MRVQSEKAMVEKAFILPNDAIPRAWRAACDLAAKTTLWGSHFSLAIIGQNARGRDLLPKVVCRQMGEMFHVVHINHQFMENISPPTLVTVVQKNKAIILPSS
ncbi:hypothetical protein PHMEG_00017454 [Phytophthora megakarya]|uniref:Uncharacterized protein n=1 Tax=Phytophthora megakarya TaxID=4795 RepID=A0A225VWR6_9STRA|nr:hypothetical protein PHMEG_00017454 [Phytophthora megakarya]